MRRLVLAVLVAAFSMSAAGCSSEPGALDGYRARDSQQSLPCDGLPAVPADHLRLLPRDAKVVAATVCHTDFVMRPGQGRWQAIVTAEVRADHLPQLAAALTDQDEPSGGVCSLSLMVLPSFTVTLADGTRLRPGVPGDGCHARPGIGDALATGGEPTIQYQRLVDSQRGIDAGCDNTASQPAAWIDVGDLPPAPQARRYSLCRYRTVVPDDKGGPLTAVGSATADQVSPLWTAASTSPRPGCTPSGRTFAAPAEGWMMITVPPAQPPKDADGLAGATMVAVVELGGCYRIIGPAEELHYADAALVARLAALTAPVPELTVITTG